MINWYTITTRDSAGKLGAVYAVAPDAAAARTLAVRYLRDLPSKRTIVRVRERQTPPPVSGKVLQ